MYVGPYRIQAVLNDVNFVIKKSPKSKCIVAHVDKLRTYYGPKPACWSGYEDPEDSQQATERPGGLVACNGPGRTDKVELSGRPASADRH